MQSQKVYLVRKSLYVCTQPSELYNNTKRNSRFFFQANAVGSEGAGRNYTKKCMYCVIGKFVLFTKSLESRSSRGTSFYRKLQILQLLLAPKGCEVEPAPEVSALWAHTELILGCYSALHSFSAFTFFTFLLHYLSHCPLCDTLTHTKEQHSGIKEWRERHERTKKNVNTVIFCISRNFQFTARQALAQCCPRG